MGEMRIAVEEPIEHAGRSYGELVLREPRLSQVQQAEAMLTGTITPELLLDSETELVAIVAEWPVEVVRKLPVSVLDRASTFLAEFQAEPAEPDEGQVLEILLDETIEVAKGTFCTLELREPTVAQRKRATGHLSRGTTPVTSRRFEVDLVAAVSGWPMPAVLRLPISAHARAAAFLTGFFMGGRRTGARSPRI